ncbi:3'-5'-exoribonuclease [Agyrium rufum]|nr:3'-5'-exoribonuclease [Agyrium rufum]
MTDRRRVNGPPGGTAPPISIVHPKLKPARTRAPDDLRKIYLRTSLTPPASGSAYLEIPPPPSPSPVDSLLKAPNHPRRKSPPSLKLTCTVHGPRPLPRSAPFTPYMQLSTTVKFAPFAIASRRRGYVRDSTERDLAAKLENALRGAVIVEGGGKSGADIIVTILECEENGNTVGDVVEDSEKLGNDQSEREVSNVNTAMMGVLAGCVTVASAALVDAGIRCLDLVVGGVAGLSIKGNGEDSQNQHIKAERQEGDYQIILDPSVREKSNLVAACMVGYLPSRDEITELWITGFVPGGGLAAEELVDGAIRAASQIKSVLIEAVNDGTRAKLRINGKDAG